MTISVLRAVLDRNAVEGIAHPPSRYTAIRVAVADGRLDLLWTHITIDELARIDDWNTRAKLTTIAAAVCRFVPTGAGVWGVDGDPKLSFSRWDFFRWAEDAEAIEAYRKGNLRHTRDALLAATAEYEHAGLLTGDQTLTARARNRGVQVWTPDELAAELGLP